MATTPILQTVDLKKYYRQGEHAAKALGGVNLSVNAGEFAAIAGTSGSGKSTLLHMIGGLDTPTSRDIIMNGKRLSKKNEEQMVVFRRRHIGFVFQNYNLVPLEIMMSTWLLKRFENEPVIGGEITLSVGWDDCDATEEEASRLSGYYTDTSYY